MTVMIQNMTNSLVLLRLNSGEVLHFGPLKTIKGIHDAEVKDNEKFRKLKGRGEIKDVPEKAKRGAKQKNGKGGAKKAVAKKAVAKKRRVSPKKARAGSI